MDSADNIFTSFVKNEVAFVKARLSFESLMLQNAGALHTVKILQCNAADGSGVPFTSAYCHTEMEPDILNIRSLGGIFWPGFSMVDSFFRDPASVPEGHNTKLLLTKLLEFLLYGKPECEKALLIDGTDMNITHTDWKTQLACHFFSKLTMSPSYVLDKNCEEKLDKCQCDCEVDVSTHYGCTGVGHGSVWHGHIDILLGDRETPVKVVEAKKTNTRGNNTSAEKNGQQFREERLCDEDILHQILAQTIVFSFLQKKQHPEYGNDLIPFIGVSREKLIFYFYDSENDILLQSPLYSFFDDGKLNDYAILATWFVINYKYLCSGITKEIKDDVKADFFRLAGNHLDIYENRLQYFESVSLKRKAFYDPRHRPCKFNFGTPLRYKRI